MNRRDLLALPVAGIWAALSPIALRSSEPKVSTPLYNDLTIQEEIALGRKFGETYEKDIEILHIHPVDSYLSGIVTKLAQASQQPSWPFAVKLVNLAAVNANAIPGGLIYVNRGLLEFVDEESEMVGAIAHEIGHVVARHTTNRLTRAFIARKVFQRVKDNLLKNNDVIAKIIESLGGAAGMLMELKYSREAETQADLLGFYEMRRADWDPNGMLKFFSLVHKAQGKQSASEVFLSDHPAIADRERVIQRELASVTITKPFRSQNMQFRAMKAALKRLPPAPRSRH